MSGVMRRAVWVLACALALAVGSGCGDDGAASEDTGGGTSGGSTSANTEVTLVELQGKIFSPSCSFDACHGGENPKNGLDLASVERSAASLIGASAKDGQSVRVVPGDAAASQLVQTLRGEVGAVRQMPLGFTLEPDKVALIEAWINAGAPMGEGDVVVDVGEGGEDPNADGPKPEDLPAPALEEGFQMGIDTMAPAGSEIWKCYVADLPGSGLVAVNEVESLQTPGVHHMDVMALGLLNISQQIAPGMHDCDVLYDTYAEMMEDGIFLFATQNTQEKLTLPPNVAAVVPGNLRVMIELHYVNPTPRDVQVWSRINAYTMDLNDVEDQIWGSAVRDSDINVPPKVEDHVEWTRCVLNRDVEMILLSSHTHELAKRVDVFAFDGVKRGELLYQNDDWHAPELKQFETPRRIPAGEGFEFQCHYRNPKETVVNWGFGAEDEMCQIAFVHTPFDINAVCETVASGAGPLATVPAE